MTNNNSEKDIKQKAVLALSDGTIFEGYAFGYIGEMGGEVVFNTSLTGYQEILTDPSYTGQIVTLTYPQIGNYGISEEDFESSIITSLNKNLGGFSGGKVTVNGLVVKDFEVNPSNYRSSDSLSDYLIKNRIPAIYGIDTRALTMHLRDKGSMTGVISTVEGVNAKSVYSEALKVPSLSGRDLVKEVTCSEPYCYNEMFEDINVWSHDVNKNEVILDTEKIYNVVAFDFGIKTNILRSLASSGCVVTVVPATTTAKEVLAMKPDGVFLSNGPGDPEPVDYAKDTVKELIGQVPIFGICLGHQILSLALGASTYKLKFGHRGGNQPVKDLATGKVEITSQNHGFAVDEDSLKGITEVTHINLNDKTVEGIADYKRKFFSVQYHPEASPGPHDSAYLFKRFTDLMGD